MSCVEVHSRYRLLPLLIGLLAVMLLFAAVDSWNPKAFAQADEEEGAKPAATAPASTPARPNIFMHLIKSVGPFFGLVLLIVSIALVTLVVLLSMELRMASAIPPTFV